MDQSKKLNRVKIALEHGAGKFVEYESGKLAHRLRDVTSFEHECYYYIGRAIENLNEDLRSANAIIKRTIIEVRNRHLKRRSIEQMLSLESLAGQDSQLDDKGRKKVWQPTDVLANIEDNFLNGEALNEKIALLAKDDSRKVIRNRILQAWMIGIDNDLELSILLAKEFGGQSESHRKFIRRFRKQCQITLAA